MGPQWPDPRQMPRPDGVNPPWPVSGPLPAQWPEPLAAQRLPHMHSLRPGPGLAQRPRHVTAQRIGCLVGLVLAVIIFIGAYFGMMTMLNVFQPVAGSGAPAVTFVVTPDESLSAVANQLQSAGLIRNAFIFELWAKYRGLGQALQAGPHQLSPSMTMDQIIQALEGSPTQPPAVWVTIPEGKRIFELPAYFIRAGLKNFSAAQFLAIAHSGVFPGASRYWFLKHAPQGYGPEKDALEGFLFPSTYDIPKSATALDVITIMLNGFGEQLCPGPPGNIDAYIYNEQACMAHGRIIAPGVTIFTAMQQHHLTLFQTMTLASLVERESRTPAGHRGVASVYYNRFQVSLGRVVPPDGPGSGLGLLDADPTVQYALGTPGDPWPQLQDQGRNLAQHDPYNTYIYPGLPPGPISGFGLDSFEAAADPPVTNYYYFFVNAEGKIYYASTYAQHLANIAKYGP
jgi:UPF0755 protein